MKGIGRLIKRLNILVKPSATPETGTLSLEQVNHNALLFSAALFSIISCIFNFLDRLDSVLDFFTVFSSLLLIYLYFLSRLRNYFNIWLTTVTILLVLSVCWFMNGGLIGSIAYIYLLAIIMLISMAKRQQQNGVFGLFLLNIAVLYMLEYFWGESMVHPYRSRQSYYSDIIFVFLQTMVCLFFLSRFIKRSYDEEHAMVVSQKSIIEKQNEEHLSSLTYASNLQKKIISDERQLFMLFSDYFVLFKPKDIVSGDFYWIKEKENYSIVVVADCTGHGVPAAFLGILGISLLEDIIKQETGPLNSGVILEKLRNRFVAFLLKNDPAADHPRDGIDMAICLINYQDYSFQFSGANRSLIMVRSNDLPEAPGYDEKDKSETHTLYGFRGTKNTIGFNYKELPFIHHNIHFHFSDAFYIFSDGFGDQFNAMNRKKFTVGQMKKEFLKVQNLTMPQQKEYFYALHKKWKGEVEQTDDILVVGLRM